MLSGSRKKTDIFNYINIFIMLGICFLTLYPIWYTLIMSFNDGKDAMYGGIYWWPREFTLDNYAAAFKNPAIFTAYMITIARTFITTTLHVFFTAMVAYACSKKHLLARNLYLAAGTITLFFSGGLIPTFLLMKNLGLLDNFLIYVVPGMFSFYNLLIITSFYRTLPDAVEESAKMDGANDFIIFIRIILPICKPVLATIALFVGVANWNDYFTGVIYIRNPQLRPIQTFLYQVIAETNTSSEMMQHMPADMKATMGITPESIKMATMIVTTAPVVVIYPFLQKYFVKGMMIGSVKG